MFDLEICIRSRALNLIYSGLGISGKRPYSAKRVGEQPTYSLVDRGVLSSYNVELDSI